MCREAVKTIHNLWLYTNMLADVWTWVRLPPAPLYFKKGGGTEIDR